MVLIPEIIAPAVVADNGAVVCSPYNGLLTITAAFSFRIKDLQGKEGGSFLTVGSISSGQAGNAFSVVIDGGNGTGHVGAVVSGSDAGRMVDEIVTVGQIYAAGQIFVGEFYSLVHDGHNHIGITGGDVVPDRKHIHIHAGNGSSGGSVVMIMPLEILLRVVEEGDGIDGLLQGDLHHFHAGNVRQGILGLGGGHTALVGYHIPLVETGLAVTGLKLAGIREQALHRYHIQLIQGGIESRGLGQIGAAFQSNFHLPDQIISQIHLNLLNLRLGGHGLLGGDVLGLPGHLGFPLAGNRQNGGQGQHFKKSSHCVKTIKFGLKIALFFQKTTSPLEAGRNHKD